MSWDPDKIRIDIARDLREIRRLYAGLRAEAYFSAVGSDVADLPAINLLGPASRPADWERVFDAAEEKYFDLLARGEATESDRPAYVADQVGEYHPLFVLASWEDVIREQLGTQTTKRATVADAAKFLASAVDWMLDCDENGDMNFIAIDQLARDLHDCRTRLENVLKDGKREDRGVPCMNCGIPLTRVRHRYPLKCPVDAREDRPDSWKCVPCGETSTMEQYNQAVKADYLRNADRLTSSDMLRQYRISPGTLVVWASRGKVRKRGKDESGRRLYDVADALKQRDKTASEDVA